MTRRTRSAKRSEEEKIEERDQEEPMASTSREEEEEAVVSSSELPTQRVAEEESLTTPNVEVVNEGNQGNPEGESGWEVETWAALGEATVDEEGLSLPPNSSSERERVDPQSEERKIKIARKREIREKIRENKEWEASRRSRESPKGGEERSSSEESDRSERSRERSRSYSDSGGEEYEERGRSRRRSSSRREEYYERSGRSRKGRSRDRSSRSSGRRSKRSRREESSRRLRASELELESLRQEVQQLRSSLEGQRSTGGDRSGGAPAIPQQSSIGRAEEASSSSSTLLVTSNDVPPLVALTYDAVEDYIEKCRLYFHKSGGREVDRSLISAKMAAKIDFMRGDVNGKVDDWKDPKVLPSEDFYAFLRKMVKDQGHVEVVEPFQHIREWAREVRTFRNVKDVMDWGADLKLKLEKEEGSGTWEENKVWIEDFKRSLRIDLPFHDQARRNRFLTEKVQPIFESLSEDKRNLLGYLTALHKAVTAIRDGWEAVGPFDLFVARQWPRGSMGGRSEADQRDRKGADQRERAHAFTCEEFARGFD